MQIIRKEIKKRLVQQGINQAIINEIYDTILNKGSRRTSKTNLLSRKDCSFAVLIDKIKPRKIRSLFEYLDVVGLTVYGDGSNKARKFSHDPVFGISKGDVIVFGKSNKFDVELSSPTRTLFKEIGNTKPVYSLSKDFEEILDAVEQYGTIKSKLLKKYPQNKHSRTLHEMMCMEGRVATKQTNKRKATAKVKVTISSNWYSIGNDFFHKNAADTVVVRDEHFVTTIPGCYSRHLVY